MNDRSDQPCTPRPSADPDAGSDLPPSLDAIEALALAARDALPDPFRQAARAVRLHVAELAPEDMLRDLGIDDPFSLTGLYEGVPLTEVAFSDPQGPSVIWLFQRALLDEWIARGDIGLADLVTHIYVHELAHHFGWSDAQIAKIDRWWE
ncbi:metallopeptidase family protein [Thioclava sp. GXIMD2076]|uniref:metallopeptidase family protein n=1 Tax=Thioclava sp. GXIMD2076 TaxID=3131931 RepID=UPI0030CEE055